ncbi:MAG: molybdopterin-dependent oxidoreductase [Bacteroidota bacterium]
MPTINIDGKDYEFEGKHGLLQFCLDSGVEIPYFCYHPAMSTPTNCRMCLIELGFHARDRATGEFQFDDDGNPVVNWGRKPATSCNTNIGPGMFVKTHRTSEVIKDAQKGVLEYMLINHPLDCPICDQAGECPLQIWTYKYGPEGSRFEVQKQHKAKRIDLGPNVIMDGERCINCTRCTRFTEEISGSNQLSIINRGDKNLPATAPGEVFDDPYSMNTIDICPVGALTSKAHRFKARVWEMVNVPSIDLCDSTGTNIDVWMRDNEVMRITPRHNSEINDYWMPDAHRLDVAKYNEHRVSGVKLKGDIPVSFGDGLQRAAELVQSHEGEYFLLGSAYAPMEANFMLQQMASKLGVDTIYYIPHIEEGFGDDWLIQDDRTPNAAACELLGFTAIELEDLKAKLAGGEINFLYALENDRFFGQIGEELAQTTVIAHAYQHQASFEQFVDVLLPAAMAIEGEGTFINKKGIPQVTKMARQIRQMTPEMWMRLPKSRLDKSAVAIDRWRDLENVMDVLPSWQLISAICTLLGHEDLKFAEHKHIFPVMQQAYEVLAELKVSYKAPKSSFKTSQLDYAPNW